MERTLVLLLGLAGGVLLSGLAIGLLLPVLPEAWHSQRLVWGASAALVVASVAIAFRVSRSGRS